MPDIPAATVEISAKAGAGLDKSRIPIPNFFDKSSEFFNSFSERILLAMGLAANFPMVNPTIAPKVKPIQIIGIAI